MSAPIRRRSMMRIGGFNRLGEAVRRRSNEIDRLESIVLFLYDHRPIGGVDAEGTWAGDVRALVIAMRDVHPKRS